MLRLLVLALLVLLLLRAAMLLVARARASAERQVNGPGRAAASSSEELVRCTACGTRVPASRALSGDAGRYCSHVCRTRSPGGAA